MFYARTTDNSSQQEIDAALITQTATWKTVEIDSDFIATQNQISHYQFKKGAFQQMVSQKMWLMFGLI